MYPSTCVTSIGMVSPFGMSLQELAMSNIQRKSESYDPFDMSYHNLCNIMGETLNISPKDLRIMDKHSLMLIKASDEAFKGAGFDRYEAEEIGYYASIGMVDYKNEDLLPAVIKSMNQGELDYELFFKRGYREIYPLWPLSMLNNIALCQSAIRLHIKGDNAVFTPHSDSSLQALNEAVWSISNGHCKVALAGGVSEVITPLSIARYLLCNNNDSRVSKRPKRINQPMTEGAVIFGIEDSNTQNKSICEIGGFGSAFGFDEERGGVTGRAIISAMDEALKKAQIERVDMVITHYNTFYEESENEVTAIRDLLGEDVLFLSTKPYLGDMLSSAGVFDCVLAICILNDVIPIFLRNHIKSRQYQSILINAFSVEGNATSIILKRGNQ